MNFASVKSLTIPEGSVYQILSGSTVLWKKAGIVPPVPPITVRPILIDSSSNYILDYQITTGEEMGVADIEYNQEWSSYTDKSGWAKMIGYHTGNYGKKWFLGCYKGGNLNPGTQFGGSGDRTLTVPSATEYDNNIKRRNIWKYGWGFIYAYETAGNWVEGTLIGSRTGGRTSGNKWPELIGQNLVMPINYDTRWTNSFLFYGLRIYSSGKSDGTTSGSLLADYVGAELNGVEGIYNYTTNTFITSSVSS